MLLSKYLSVLGIGFLLLLLPGAPLATENPPDPLEAVGSMRGTIRLPVANHEGYLTVVDAYVALDSHTMNVDTVKDSLIRYLQRNTHLLIVRPEEPAKVATGVHLLKAHTVATNRITVERSFSHFRGITCLTVDVTLLTYSPSKLSL